MTWLPMIILCLRLYSDRKRQTARTRTSQTASVTDMDKLKLRTKSRTKELKREPKSSLSHRFRFLLQRLEGSVERRVRVRVRFHHATPSWCFKNGPFRMDNPQLPCPMSVQSKRTRPLNESMASLRNLPASVRVPSPRRDWTLFRRYHQMYWRSGSGSCSSK